MSIHARMDKYSTRDSSGCTIWVGSKNSRGYGVIYFEGKLHLAHRVAWVLAHGDWPKPGLVLDHRCNVKACVNARHLREMENWRNLRRAVPRGDDATEKKRAAWRKANAKRRGNYTYVEEGWSESLGSK